MSKQPITSGVYAIRNLENGHVYVGSSTDIDHRWRTHIQALLAGRHSNRSLQSAWADYGTQAFAFQLLEIAEPVSEHLGELEDAWARHFTDHGVSLYSVLPQTRGRLTRPTLVKLPALSRWRIRRGLTQEKLGQKAQVSRVNIARIETGGETRPGTALLLATALGCSIDDLMAARED